MYITNEKLEPKEKPIKEISVPFQGENLHPCIGLVFWFRWGKYCFDIRDIRKLYGVKSVKAIDDKRLSQASFCEKMSEIIKLVGKEDFVDVMSRC